MYSAGMLFVKKLKLAVANWRNAQLSRGDCSPHSLFLLLAVGEVGETEGHVENRLSSHVQLVVLQSAHQPN